MNKHRRGVQYAPLEEPDLSTLYDTDHEAKRLKKINENENPTLPDSKLSTRLHQN